MCDGLTACRAISEKKKRKFHLRRVSSSSFCAGLSGGEEFRVACLAPEIAGQTSDGQLCWGDCALGWPVWIRGALLSVTQGCLCVPAAAAGKLAVQREKRGRATLESARHSQICFGAQIQSATWWHFSRRIKGLEQSTVPGGLAKRPQLL